MRPELNVSKFPEMQQNPSDEKWHFLYRNRVKIYVFNLKFKIRGETLFHYLIS